MINELIKLANALDESGLEKEADAVDHLIKSADDGVDPDIDFSDVSQAGFMLWIPGLSDLVAMGLLTSTQADKIHGVAMTTIEKILRKAGPLADKYAKMQRIPRSAVAADIIKHIKFAPKMVLFLAFVAGLSSVLATAVFAYLDLLPKAGDENIFWIPLSSSGHKIDWEHARSHGLEMLTNEVMRVLKRESPELSGTSPMNKQLVLDEMQ